jgi:hypothetical protein
MIGTNRNRGDHRQREPARTLRHALAMAGGTWAAEHAIRRSRPDVHRARTLVRVTSHVLGYGALLGYILSHRRAAAAASS